MSRRLPPLNALRAFEASARLKSFTKAADELCVSPAAVSQQIKVLEQYLNILLFSRAHKNLQLTPAGSAYFPIISEGFNTLLRAGQRLSEFQLDPHLTVSALPSVASKWLAPRLFSWLEEHSEIDVKVIATHEEADFPSEDIDFRISYGQLDYKNVSTQQLFIDKVYPVCSPRLLEKHPLNEPGDITEHTLIHVGWGNEYKSLPSWQDWLREVGVDKKSVQNGPEFNLSSMAIQSVIDGQGVMLGQHMMVSEDIKSGRLVKPLDVVLPLNEPYHVIYPQQTLSKPYAIDFLNWLIELGVD